MSEEQKKKKKLDRQRVRALLGDAWDLIWRSRRRLLLGIPLLLLNRVTSIILPWLTKVLIDDVIAKGHHELLWELAVASGTCAFSWKRICFVVGSTTIAAEYPLPVVLTAAPVAVAGPSSCCATSGGTANKRVTSKAKLRFII